MVSQVSESWAFEQGSHRLDRGQFVGVKKDHLQLVKGREVGLLRDAGEVVVGQVQLDEVGAFWQEVEVLIQEVVACQHQYFQLLRSDDLPIEERLSLLLTSPLYLFLSPSHNKL